MRDYGRAINQQARSGTQAKSIADAFPLYVVRSCNFFATNEDPLRVTDNFVISLKRRFNFSFVLNCNTREPITSRTRARRLFEVLT